MLLVKRGCCFFFYKLKMKFFAAILLAATISLAIAEKARFDNYRVYRLNIENELQLSVLQQIEQFPDGVSFFFFSL